MLATSSPFPQYFDIDGDPLDGGLLYFGQPNQNPKTTPVAIYWDAAGTQLAAQPIRTMNGYTARAGTPAQVYIGGRYSIAVYDKRGRLLYYCPDSAEFSNAASILADLTNDSDPSKGPGLIQFNAELPYPAGSVGSKLRERISVSDYRSLVFTATAKDLADPLSHTATSFLSWRLAIQAALDEAASRPGGAHVIIDGGQAPYAQAVLLIDDHITIGANTTVEFLAEVKLADYTTIGGTIVPGGDNITILNPRLDNSSIYAGGSGQNGIAPTGTISNLKVFGGKIRNCARGGVAGRDGGKGFQFESTYSDVVVDGSTVENCFMAMSAKHDFPTTDPCGPLLFTGITARSCEILLFVRQTSGRDITGQEHSVILSDFRAVNCGTYQGLIQLSRASNVLVANGIISNSTSIDSLIRGNHAFCRFEGIDYFGDCTSLINLDTSDYALDASYVCENNAYDIKQASGVTQYVANSSLSTPNRVLQDCEIRVMLQNDVGTKIVGDELRNGYCLIHGQQGNRTFMASTATLFLQGRTKFINFDAGHNVPVSNITGVTFPATQVPSSNVNTLDDYEENANASPLAFTDNSGAGLTFTTANGDYTKIGRMVFMSFNITFPVNASGAANSIAGLPFPAVNNARGSVGLAVRFTDVALANVSASVNANTSLMTFIGGGAILTNAQLSGKTVSGVLSYMTA